MNVLRAVTYIRVSSDDQVHETTGLQTQQIEADRLAERLGAVVVARESDPGISGTLPPGPARPGILRALNMLQRGEADCLIAYNTSRLGRKALVTLTIWETVKEARARLLLCDLGEITEKNEFFLTVSGGFAQHEWQELKEKMANGRRRRAEEGRMPCRVLAPFGYRIIRATDPDATPETVGRYLLVEQEARWVREIFERIATGESLRKVCAWLQQAGVPTPHAKRMKKRDADGERLPVAEPLYPSPYWRAASVSCILANPVYRGEAVYGQRERRIENGRKVLRAAPPEKERVRIEVPPLVSVQLWQRCQEQLKVNRENSGTRNDRRHLWAGLMRCPVCGNRMEACNKSCHWDTKEGRKASVRTYYRCQQHSPSSNAARRVCSTRSFVENTVTTFVAAMIERLENEPQFVEGAMLDYLEAQQQADASADLGRISGELTALANRETATARAKVDAIAQGQSTAVYDQFLKEINAERTRLEARKRSIEETLSQTPQEDPKEAVELAAEMARGMKTILTAEKLTDAEKNAYFSRFIEEIRPTEEGFRATLRPFRVGSYAVPVAYGQAYATGKGYEVRFEFVDATSLAKKAAA